MTGTFTLTGRILDKSTAPVAGARLVLASSTEVLRDPVTNEVYAPPPRVTTDDDGYLCVADADGVPAAEPGVELVVGVQYGLRGVNPNLLGRLLFTAPDEGETLDIADIINEPPAADPSWSDALAALRDDFELIAGQTFAEDPSNPGLFLVTEGGNDRLLPADEDGLYVLAEDPDPDQRFITFDLATETLPQVVEDHIDDLASGLDPDDNLSDLTNVATARTNLGLGTGATKDVASSGNASSAQVVKGDDSRLSDSRTPAAHKTSHATGGSDALTASDIGALTASSNLSDVANAATARTNLGLGTAATSASSAFQASDAELTAIAGLTSAANKLPYFTGSGTAALADLTAFGRALLDDADAATARGSLGLGTAATAASTDFQPVDTDLTAIAALTTTTFGRSLLTQADAAAARTTLGVDTSGFQPVDSDLTAIAALTTTTFGRSLLALADAAAARTTLGGLYTSAEVDTLFDNLSDTFSDNVTSVTTGLYQPIDSDLTAIAALTTTSYGRAFLALADAAAGRTVLGLGTAATSASTAFQAADAELTAIAGLTSAADKVPYFTGSGTASTATVTSFARTLLDDTDAATARTTLGVMAAPAAWQALTLSAVTVPTALDAPAARLVGTDKVEFRGTGVKITAAATAATIDSTTGAVTPGTIFATLPSGLWPAKTRTIAVGLSNSTASTRLLVTTAGELMSYGGGVTNGAQILFDGVYFTL